MIGLTLGRYFFTRYLTIFFWIFVGLATLIFIIDFTEFSNRTSGLKDYQTGIALAVSAFRVPILMQQSIPFIALFGAMATFISLNRKHELVIARSAGVSAWQFLFPACLGALLIGFATLFGLNTLAAYGFERAEELESQIRSGRANASTAFSVPWLKQSTSEGETIIGAGAVLDQGLRLGDAIFIRLDGDGNVVERLDAKTAMLREGHWQLENVAVTREGTSREVRPSMQVPTELLPAMVQERIARPESIPFLELGQKIETARSLGLSANAFAMEYHSLATLPVLLVAMTLIAATVSMGFARLGQSGTMILGGILAGFLLYVVSVSVKAFGSAGFVSPIAAAWFPVIVAMFFGVTFLLHKEDG